MALTVYPRGRTCCAAYDRIFFGYQTKVVLILRVLCEVYSCNHHVTQWNTVVPPAPPSRCSNFKWQSKSV